MPTPLNICPFSISVPAPSAIVVPDAQPEPNRGAFCIGPKCHLWRFGVGEDPVDGDCTFNLLTNFMSNVNIRVEQAFAAGAASASPAARG